jgi:hypothetical protein
MADYTLSQSEADALLALAKYCLDQTQWPYPPLGVGQTIERFSQDKRESFLLDLERSRLNLQKGKYQTRGRQITPLARLCFGGPPHRNPDDVEIPRPHIHVYKEGAADKWAFPLPIDGFPNQNDLWLLLQDFMRYCNIVQPPIFQRGMLP